MARAFITVSGNCQIQSRSFSKSSARACQLLRAGIELVECSTVVWTAESGPWIYRLAKDKIPEDSHMLLTGPVLRCLTTARLCQSHQSWARETVIAQTLNKPLSYISDSGGREGGSQGDFRKHPRITQTNESGGLAGKRVYPTATSTAGLGGNQRSQR